ncbi:MAG: hypothetical protein JW794_10095, partial [Candidatus Cloacimonetes bacterium]|nr:hypothetical protein [Candidatus Cloacimonadota bacterium]
SQNFCPVFFLRKIFDCKNILHWGEFDGYEGCATAFQKKWSMPYKVRADCWGHPILFQLRSQFVSLQ